MSRANGKSLVLRYLEGIKLNEKLFSLRFRNLVTEIPVGSISVSPIRVLKKMIITEKYI